MPRPRLPCVLYRGGTSKGLFLDGRDLMKVIPQLGSSKSDSTSSPTSNLNQNLNSNSTNFSHHHLRKKIEPLLLALLGSPDPVY